MATKKYKPITSSLRHYESNKQNLASNNPVPTLTTFLKKDSGRNNNGRITSRRRGGGHKRRYRLIDFKRQKKDIIGTIASIEYDPNRSSNIALINYKDGEKNYILSPAGIKIGDKIISTDKIINEYKSGYSLPLINIPLSTFIHCVELEPGKGAQIARSAGSFVQYMSLDPEKKLASLKMPSGELRYVNSKCRATIGKIGNSEHRNIKIGKAGRNRWLGRRPRVRGVAMNPVDHPMGGGEGRTSGGGHPCSPWNQLAKGGKRTRRKSKPTNKMIIINRKGKKFKR